MKNVWIVKPGELSNRGQGITVIDEMYELNTILKKREKHFNGTEKTYIVQKYIEKPLLYKGRKFDIRHYMMISRLHGCMRAYWFGEGYIRTSSYEFNINDIGEEIIHLTNDAIQKYCDGYGKYEEGNKVSYNDFQRYMDSLQPETSREGKEAPQFSFSEMIYPRMKAIALDAVKATYLQLDPNSLEHNFEIFGLDFMIDCNYDVWLIEVNTNPCLELSSKLLARIIPTMVEQSLRLTLDAIFPPPTHYPNSQKYLAPDNPLERLQFELIFDEDRDGEEVEALFANAKKVDMGEVDEED
ncbi:uncharacterized protein LOC116268178 [Nymphaea colorata]|uniref:uncharacterized protein LOC116268178 n=1 Tax=Nymphaea colorata TaxID=210225 RepID=UPI00129DBD98|nr:uncharacterized protein LOC116268178 [Nymphaea colorata]